MFSSHLSPISSSKNVLLCVHVLAYMYNLHVRAGVCMCHSMSVEERGQLLVVDSLLLCFEVWSLLFLPCCIHTTGQLATNFLTNLLSQFPIWMQSNG